MRIFVSFFIWILTFIYVHAANKYRRVCYYSSWAIYRPTSGKFSPSDIDPFLCTHIIYAFAKLNEESSILETFDPWADLEDNYGLGGYQKVTALRNQNPRLKILISVGGWNAGSSGFSEMVSTRLKRKTFIESALRFLRKHNFDGLDINWEFPGVRGGRDADRNNFDLLVQELRDAVDAEPALSGKPRLLISAAVSASDKTVQTAYNPSILGKFLDFISIMTYDFHGSWDSNVEHHSPIYGRNRDVSTVPGFNMVSAIKLWIKAGCPADKIVVGIPFYGRSFTLTDAHVTAPGSPAVGGGEPGPFTREPGFLSYFEVCSLLMDKTWTVVIDPEERTPYAYKEDQWIGYDDIDSIIKKTVIVREWGLGGVMVWSVDMDDFRGLCGPQSYPMLRMIKKVLEFQPVRVVNLLPAIPQALAHSFPAQMHPTIPPRLLLPSEATPTNATTPTTPAMVIRYEKPKPSDLTPTISGQPSSKAALDLDAVPTIQVQAVVHPKTRFFGPLLQPPMMLPSQILPFLSRSFIDQPPPPGPMGPPDPPMFAKQFDDSIPNPQQNQLQQSGQPFPMNQDQQPQIPMNLPPQQPPQMPPPQQSPQIPQQQPPQIPQQQPQQQPQQTAQLNTAFDAPMQPMNNQFNPLTPFNGPSMLDTPNKPHNEQSPQQPPLQLQSNMNNFQQPSQGPQSNNNNNIPLQTAQLNTAMNHIQQGQQFPQLTSVQQTGPAFSKPFMPDEQRLQQSVQSPPVQNSNGINNNQLPMFNNDLNGFNSRQIDGGPRVTTATDMQVADSNINNGVIPFNMNMNSQHPSMRQLEPMQCPAEGFFRNPQDCTKFYRCVNMLGSWTVWHFFCPAGLVFDPNHAVCNWVSMSPPC
ncbi:uncharacterized protein LOC129593893 [Paramacrobiotus metropolitanus]|uniref:uncharacterized protein LOC129593893 n=1 Tax=Paramacrobiotus metropolitanus TaxID=2943436 RepID=UPI002445E20A|nr:uncharacterized protein LOC129593893 [Paramacrobiotus metropolitanus]